MPEKEFTHLQKDEKAIAQRWLRKALIQGKRTWDVHLNVPVPKHPDWWTKKDLANWHSLVDKKIDLVVENSAEVWIVEFTPRLSKTVIGGCISYKELYQKQFKPDKPIKLAAVVEMDDPAYHPVLDQLEITLWVV